MKKNNVLAYSLILCMTGICVLSSCERPTTPDLEVSIQPVRELTPIAGTNIEKFEIFQQDDQDSYLMVRFNDGRSLEAWCIEWNEEESFGIQKETAKFFSTKGHEAWEKLNYFISIKNNLMSDDASLTFREIQVVIWSLIENPVFNVDNIGEYKNIDPRIYKDGQPLFNVQKVKSIVNKVNSQFSTVQKKINYPLPGTILVQNDGQTILLGSETTFAVKTKTETGETVVDSDYSKCFDEEIIENVSFPNWGWTNKIQPNSNLTFDLYAGAGQCNLSKGTRVGELTVVYSAGTLTATYRISGSLEFVDTHYALTETHLYVGSEPYPKKKTKYTVAPGQYGHQNTHNNVSEFTYSIDGLSGEIYFIAHGVVNSI